MPDRQVGFELQSLEEHVAGLIELALPFELLRLDELFFRLSRLALFSFFAGVVETEHAVAGQRIGHGSAPNVQVVVAVLRAIPVTIPVAGKRLGLAAERAIPAFGRVSRHRGLRERQRQPDGWFLHRRWRWRGCGWWPRWRLAGAERVEFIGKGVVRLQPCGPGRRTDDGHQGHRPGYALKATRCGCGVHDEAFR